MSKIVAAVWHPDADALAALRRQGAVVRVALDDQGRYAAGEPFVAFVTMTVEDPAGLVPPDLGARAGPGSWTSAGAQPRCRNRGRK